MKIHHVTGCTAFSLNVDGLEEVNMTHEQRIEVIEAIYRWMKNNADEQLNYILQGLTNSCGEYHIIDDQPCECCGDIVDEMVLDLNG